MPVFQFFSQNTSPQCWPAVPSDTAMLPRPEPEGGVAHPKSTQATGHHRYDYNREDDTLSCFLNAITTGAGSQASWRFL